MASGVSAARAAEEPPPPEPPAEQKPPPAPPAPAQEEFSFLPLVHDIIKCWRAVTREDRIPHRHTSLETGEL